MSCLTGSSKKKVVYCISPSTVQFRMLKIDGIFLPPASDEISAMCKSFNLVLWSLDPTDDRCRFPAVTWSLSRGRGNRLHWARRRKLRRGRQTLHGMLARRDEINLQGGGGTRDSSCHERSQQTFTIPSITFKNIFIYNQWLPMLRIEVDLCIDRFFTRLESKLNINHILAEIQTWHTMKSNDHKVFKDWFLSDPDADLNENLWWKPNLTKHRKNKIKGENEREQLRSKTIVLFKADTTT